MLFRVILLHHLDFSIVGIILFSLCFALVHAANPNLTLVSLLNIFFFGILLAILYKRTKNLWQITTVHFCWNYLNGIVFGLPLSGLKLTSRNQLVLVGDKTTTGRSFGLEGSLVTTVYLILMIIGHVYKLTMRSKMD